MGSKREEERNEKIIRGLMKLPPNRRCINCNSLGPQYVCTNFWTFICMTCSGIHREFTHRVKSVSMSKFSSQEVEALQNGGNQRAREIYLKDWDQQRQRLPDNSNVDKVREFIKYVYVDRKYAGGKTADKPPRDLQRLGSHEDEIRRASSYHSYSQSPPYDFQYEDRRYGKQAPVLTRKPGSDRGLYPGKVSSFISSPPASLNERALEDRFANEGSDSRISDYSLSSGFELVRSGTESPNFQKESGFSSPPVQPSSGENASYQKINLFSEAKFKSNSDGVPLPQRSTSLGSIGSFDSNLISLKSNYSGSSIIDVVSGRNRAAQLPQDTVSGFLQPSTADPDSSDLFKAPSLLGASASIKSDIDLFQFSASSPTMSVDLFQVSPSNPSPTMNFNQSSQTSPHSSLDLVGESAQQQPVIAVDKKLTEALVSKDEGWATFDIPQHSLSSLGTENLTASPMRSGVGSVKFDQVSSLNTSTQCPEFQNSGSQVSSSISSSDLWHGNFHNVEAGANATDAQTWNAFDDSITQLHAEGIKQISELQLKSHEPLSSADLYLGFRVSEGTGKDGIQTDASHVGFPGPRNASDFVTGSSYTLLPHTLMPEEMQMQSHPSDCRSTNPFDLPYESDLETSNMFLDVSSLQGVLPNVHVPPSFIGATHQQWFLEDPLGAYLPAAPQGGLSYMPTQAPNPRLANLQTQEPVASVGGNPFA